jgi:hypothetical protein
MQAQILLLILPFIVISVAFLYLSENHSLMRCGRYIRLHIEKKVPDIVGWENWLESDDSCDPRTVDKYVAYSIYIVLAIYYVASIWLCFNYTSTLYGSIPSAVIVGMYTGLGDRCDRCRRRGLAAASPCADCRRGIVSGMAVGLTAVMDCAAARGPFSGRAGGRRDAG